jgi:hypothetical protein
LLSKRPTLPRRHIFISIRHTLGVNSLFIMDPVGATASVITLVNLAIKTVKVINRLSRLYHDAPAEILDLKHQLDGLNGQLVLLRHVQEAVGVNALMLANTDLKNLDLFLQNTLPLLSSIRDYFEQQTLKTGKGSRLKWVLHDSSKVKGWESALRRHASGLVNICCYLTCKWL